MSNRKELVVILDPAHGEETPGKRSPDGKFREYKWSRELIIQIGDILDDNGFRVMSSNASNKEIGLSNRAAMANGIEGSRKVLISLHSNAAGNGAEWMNARGFSVYTTKGDTKSDDVAEELMTNFKLDFPELKARTDMSDKDMDIEENFTVIFKAKCPAVLIEWLFQDNKEDVSILQNKEYNDRLANSIAKSIINLYNKNII